MSSNDMPELGSKISLISKADIRYEGKLYAVDPQDCTIALSNVKSFGTEYRKTANPVPAQRDIYDYILFRATDIKDISVVPTPQQLLYDPAIVHLSAPSNLGSRYGSGNTSSGQGGNAPTATGDNTSCTHPVLGSMGNNTVHQPFSTAPGAGSTSNTGFNPMHSGLHNLARPSPSEFLHHPNNDLLTGSRSSTPALRKPSPTVDQSTQANTQQRRVNNNSPQHQQQKDRNNQSVFYRPANRNQDNRNQGNLRNNQRNDQQNQRQRTFSQQGGGQQQQQGRGWGQQQQQQRGGGIGAGGSGGGGGGIGRQRTGRLHQRGGTGGNFSRAPGGGGTRKTTTPLKFESDYDFDKANTEFEELFAKIKIADSGEGSNTAAASGAVGVVNGQEKSKDDSGNETGIVNDAEANNVEGSADQVVFYNKTKSFFDNISCEALERSKGRSQRTDWRKERKLNSETFGVSSARRGMFGRNGPRGSSGVGGGGGGYFYGNNRGSGGNFFGTRGGYRSTGGTGLFKQQNKPAYRVQQQPQVANA